MAIEEVTDPTAEQLQHITLQQLTVLAMLAIQNYIDDEANEANYHPYVLHRR